jgi:hypothetical protein
MIWCLLFSSDALLQLEKEDKAGRAKAVKPTSVINFLLVILIIAIIYLLK